MSDPISRPDATRPDEHSPDQATWARCLNAALGAWLCFSTFAWTHGFNARANGWVVGASIVLAAFWAITSPAMRLVNTALAVWLVISTFLVYHVDLATAWNNLLVAMAVFFLSLVPKQPARPPLP